PSSMLTTDLLQRLPSPVRERVRILRDRMTGSGNFVLYWLHHAMRGHENPALDAAISAGEQLGLPILVYQGLSEKYTYASDRHHTFILQGVRDLQAEFAERGVPYVCHVERPGHRGPHLR
ncbi:deoxyribodipyrimidine photo-lyase, partial [Arthrospira platensis SPKY1]|nr:deoxyribodipyrimidine photo-lyase [Arthrospira platensis SPKY1]